MKVIFLAFANNAVSPLPYLTEEDDRLQDILSDRYLLGDYLIHRESFCTPEKINRFLKLYRDNLAIFHYSGHAGPQSLLLNEGNAFALGIAAQLKHSALAKSLKLVILNGCSTCAQVKLLQDNKIPAIISTSSPVGDKGAKEFSVRLWENMVKNEQPIYDAYLDALQAAATITGRTPAKPRHLFTEQDHDCQGGDAPLWRLDYNEGSAININPVPFAALVNTTSLPEKPNGKLLNILYESFFKEGNPQIVEIWNKDKNPLTPVDQNTKQVAIVNSIPFPIGIHLQKLICPTSDPNDQGYDVLGMKRLKQITQLYQTTMEFLGIIMIAQLWELHLRYPGKSILDQNLKNTLKEYLKLSQEQREVYDYIPIIQTIRKYFTSQTANSQLKSFIDEQDILKDLLLFNDDFKSACSYLTFARNYIILKNKETERAVNICNEADKQLCSFMEPLGFIHRYQLTSVQHIDILKLRHTEKQKIEYKHSIIKCMHAVGTGEKNYYYMNTFLDNWGVILLKCEVTGVINKGNKRKFTVAVKDYLNLSPFVIDLNSFVAKCDLSNIMFFNGETTNNIMFKNVKNPTSARDSKEVLKKEEDDDNFDPIREQFDAFTHFIA